MPKEYINSENYGRSVVPDGGTDPQVMDHDALKVGWGRETQHLQIAVIDGAADPDGFDARHISLDRQGVNRLIRTLRKARDAAFGSDA